MSNTIKVHLLDDDPIFLELLDTVLTKRGFECNTSRSASSLELEVRDNVPDVFVLDYFLGTDEPAGQQLCGELRSRYDRPIVMVTGNNCDSAMIECLRAGAQHYITKPVDPEELEVRIRAALRDHWRYREGGCTTEAERFFERGGETCALYLDRGRLCFGSTSVAITEMEAELMRLFLTAPASLPTIQREAAFWAIYGKPLDPFNRAIDVLISRLRKKLRLLDPGFSIMTRRGVGYTLLHNPENEP